MRIPYRAGILHQWTVTSEDDAEHLQEDLDKLAQWGEDWFMQFHPAKCTVLTVTNKRNPIVTEYTIRGQLLATVTSSRYLGVTITDKVNWSQHDDPIRGWHTPPVDGLGSSMLAL
jgi:hypothetical protein